MKLKLNKDKRSLLLSMLIGDGTISAPGNRRTGLFSVTHGHTQEDVIRWKHSMLNLITNSEVKLQERYVKLNGKSYKQFKIAKGMKRFSAWRRMFYKNGKKDASEIIRFITHPEMAMALWLIDDGSVNYPKKNRSMNLRIHTDSESLSSVERLISWIDLNFGTSARIYMRIQRGKRYPTIRFRVKDSLKVWAVVRDFVLTFDSMKHKFRELEKKYQLTLQQPQTRSLDLQPDEGEEIVQQIVNR